jgi:hypothetical protein
VPHSPDWMLVCLRVPAGAAGPLSTCLVRYRDRALPGAVAPTLSGRPLVDLDLVRWSLRKYSSCGPARGQQPDPATG